MAKKKGILSKILKSSSKGRKTTPRAKVVRRSKGAAPSSNGANTSRPVTQKKPSTNKPTWDDNTSKRYPNGRTLKTKDKYLPIEKGKKSDNKKDERWVAVIDSNRKDELAVVRLTRQKQKNTTDLPTYKKGNRANSRFKHFVEIFDNDGNPIKVDGKKFTENPKHLDLNAGELATVKNKVLEHCMQSSENKKKIADLKKNGDSQR